MPHPGDYTHRGPSSANKRTYYADLDLSYYVLVNCHKDTHFVFSFRERNY